MSSLTTRAVEAIEGASSRDAQKAKNLFALGVLCWLYDRPVDVTERWIRGKFEGPVREANLAAFRAGWSFGETSELIDVQVRVERNVDVAPGTYRNVNGTEATALGLIAASVKSRAAARVRRLPDHARVGPAARARAPARHGRAHDPGRGRDRGGVDGARRGVRRRAGRDVHVRPGPGPQDRDDRPRGGARAADDHHRRPARRPVHGHADQDRAVRPAAGALRAPRRVAAAGGRGLLAGAVLRGRLRGGADRDHLPHAGDPAQRPVRRELERAVADPERRVAAADRPALPHHDAPGRSCRTRATTTSRGRGRFPARPGSRTGSAAWRRPTARARSPTTARTTRG